MVVTDNPQTEHSEMLIKIQNNIAITQTPFKSYQDDTRNHNFSSTHVKEMI